MTSQRRREVCSSRPCFNYFVPLRYEKECTGDGFLNHIPTTFLFSPPCYLLPGPALVTRQSRTTHVSDLGEKEMKPHETRMSSSRTSRHHPFGIAASKMLRIADMNLSKLLFLLRHSCVSVLPFLLRPLPRAAPRCPRQKLSSCKKYDAYLRLERYVSMAGRSLASEKLGLVIFLAPRARGILSFFMRASPASPCQGRKALVEPGSSGPQFWVRASSLIKHGFLPYPCDGLPELSHRSRTFFLAQRAAGVSA